MEMRILAQVSGDKRLIELLSQEGDIYLCMAAWAFDLTLDNVTKTDRDRAKTVLLPSSLSLSSLFFTTGYCQISLGILYGMGAENLAAQLTRHSQRTVTPQQAKVHFFSLLCIVLLLF